MLLLNGKFEFSNLQRFNVDKATRHMLNAPSCRGRSIKNVCVIVKTLGCHVFRNICSSQNFKTIEVSDNNISRDNNPFILFS